MNWDNFFHMLRIENPVRIKLRFTGRITRQIDEDDLLEKLWQARVKTNIDRNRGLRLLHGGKGNV